jgi:tetratricopeptide (TPR) repeat protein
MAPEAMKVLQKLVVLALAGCSLCSAAHPGIVTRFEQVDELIERYPQSQPLWLKRASLSIQHGDLKSARKDLQQAAQLGDPVETAFQMGLLHFKEGEFKKSYEDFESYLKRVPGHALSYLYRAKAARAMGQFDLAIENFEIYFRQSSNPHPGEYLAAARLQVEKSPDDYGPALQLIDQAIRRLGLIPQLQRYATDLEIHRRNFAAAIERWDSAELALGSSPEWKFKAARIHTQAGQFVRAQQLILLLKDQLRELKPTPARQQLWQEIGVLERAWVQL